MALTSPPNGNVAELERISASLSQSCYALRNVSVAQLDPKLTRRLACALEFADLALGNVLEALQQLLEKQCKACGRYGRALWWALAGLASMFAVWLGPDGFVRGLNW